MIVVQNMALSKSSCTQYVHSNSISKIWSIWLKEYLEEFDKDFEWYENISLRKDGLM